MEALCHATVDGYLQRYGWSIVGRDELLAAVEVEYAPREPGQASARAATLLCYSRALHRACSGAEGQARQEHGYVELYSFLGRAAARRYARVAGDATQRAVERVFVSFERCRQPETFLAFVLQKLRDAARVELRDAAQVAEPLPFELAGDEAALRRGDLADPAEALEREATRAGLSHHAAAFMRRHPRAVSQFAAVWMKYIDGLDDRVIAQRLGRTPAAVQVLRSRALRRLRDEPGWRQLAGELGLA